MGMLEILFGGGLLTIIGGIIGMCLQRHWTKQDREIDIENTKKRIDSIEAEECLVCYGLSACLDGLEQLGANHNVTAAKIKIEKHLNKKAHRMEDYL